MMILLALLIRYASWVLAEIVTESSCLHPICELCADDISLWNQAARKNYLLAVPACLYAVNNYLKFVMQVKIPYPCCSS